MVHFGFNFSVKGFNLNGLVYLFLKSFGLNGWEFLSGLVWFGSKAKKPNWTKTEPGPLLIVSNIVLYILGTPCL